MRSGAIVLTTESIVVLVYFATTSGPHRAVLVTIAAAITFAALGTTLFVGRIARRAWRIEFSLAWALASGIALAVSIHLDSGLDSPLVYFLVLPTISAALALPARAVVLVGAVATIEVALLAVTDPATSTSFEDLFLVLGFTVGVIVLTVGSALSRTRLQSEEATLIDELAHLAATDPLTDCLNHAGFYERLKVEIARALRYGTPLCLMIADVDLFKAYNDAHGHAMGDTALVGVASTLKSTARTSDTVARIGGDEFALILPETPVGSANQIAAKIFSSLEECNVRVTLSLGVAALDMSEPTTKRLFRDADWALYESKARGRRGVTVSRPGGIHANSELTEQPAFDTAFEDRELLEERLRHAELETLETLSILDTLQMSAPVGLGYVDREFRFLRLNSVLAAVNGSTVEDQIGRSVAEVVPELWPQLEARYHRVLDTAQPVSGGEVTGEIAGDPDQLHYWQTSLYPVNVGGEITGIGIVAVDVTDQKRVEWSRAELTRKLVAALSVLTEVRDPSTTVGHEERVAEIAVAIAQELGCDPGLIEDIDLAARIHDLGKAVIPTEILSRPGKLNEAEMNLVRRHAQVGFDILQKVDFPASVADIVLQHHERLDGSGYPNRLKGSEICVGARIVAVADAFEAMVSHRPYRVALGVLAAMMAIQEGAGRIYERDVVDVFTRLHGEGRIEIEPGRSTTGTWRPTHDASTLSSKASSLGSMWTGSPGGRHRDATEA